LPSLHALTNAMRAHGLRVSTARRRVLAALLAAERPLSAEQIAGAGDLASVYRNLETLAAIGLVQHVHFGHGPGRYALAGRGGWASCQGCGEAARLAPQALAEIRAACGLETLVTVVGLCPGCQGAPS
jgi:Fur family transcriptional regulator, ferric uptake regulator